MAPAERFEGRTREAAEALEYAAQGEGPEADELLFRWSDEHRPLLRSPGGARLAAQQDAAAREAHALEERKARGRARTGGRKAWPRGLAPGRSVAVGAGLLLAGLTGAVWLRGHQASQGAADSEARRGGRVAVGDSASTAPAAPQEAVLAGEKRGGDPRWVLARVGAR